MAVLALKANWTEFIFGQFLTERTGIVQKPGKKNVKAVFRKYSLFSLSNLDSWSLIFIFFFYSWWMNCCSYTLNKGMYRSEPLGQNIFPQCQGGGEPFPRVRETIGYGYSYSKGWKTTGYCYYMEYATWVEESRSWILSWMMVRRLGSMQVNGTIF